jgi:Rrf2 family protein
MRISTRGRYSLEALLYLAMLPEGTYASTRTIASITGISDGYLEQLFIPLRKAGLIRGIRGAQGGYMPGRDPSDIPVGDILRAVEGSLEPVACLFTEVCVSEAECPTRHTWGELYREISACIDSISLSQLVDCCRKDTKEEYAI